MDKKEGKKENSGRKADEKRVKALGRVPKSPLTIEELHQYTSSSKKSWAEAVSENREERI